MQTATTARLCKSQRPQRLSRLPENTKTDDDLFMFRKCLPLAQIVAPECKGEGPGCPAQVQQQSLHERGMLPIQYHTASAVVLFNIGVCMHVYHKSGQQESHNRAETLYRMSYSIASTIPVVADTRNPTALLVVRLLMALMNNMGNLQYGLYNFEAARDCYRALSSFLLTIPRTEDAQLNEEKRDLLLNAYMLMDDPSSAAAA